VVVGETKVHNKKRNFIGISLLGSASATTITIGGANLSFLSCSFKERCEFISNTLLCVRRVLVSIIFLKRNQKSNMDQDHSNESVPCSTGCGFFGRSSTGGMCSKCFKESLALMARPKSRPASDMSKLLEADKLSLDTDESSKSAASGSSARQPDVKKLKVMAKETVLDRTRCAECRKKVGLTGIACRCGKVYCGFHRIAEKHSCTFDFKTFERGNIEKANERVVAQSLVDKL